MWCKYWDAMKSGAKVSFSYIFGLIIISSKKILHISKKHWFNSIQNEVKVTTFRILCNISIALTQLQLE